MKTDIDKGNRSLIRRLQDSLKTGRRTLVVSHIDPDGDALGTQLAFGHYLRDLGQDVVMACDSTIPAKYQFLPEIERLVTSDAVDRHRPFDRILVLECPSLERLGKVKDLVSDNATLINIDHHPDNSWTGDINWLNSSASSVGELAFEYLAQVGYRIGPEVATQLYTAILTDTGRFRFQSTGPKTFAAAAVLVRCGAAPRSISDSVYYNMDPATIKLTGLLISRLEYYDDGLLCIMAMPRSLLAESGANLADIEGLVDYSLYTRGVQVGALLREVDAGHTKVSLRSDGSLNVSAIATIQNGGGHAGAAGCRLAMPLDKAREEVIRLVREAREAQA